MITPGQCRAARALLAISQTDLAHLAGVSRSAVIDFEGGARTPREKSMDALEVTLSKLGVVFVPENGEGAGARLKKGAQEIPRRVQLKNTHPSRSISDEGRFEYLEWVRELLK